MILQALLFLGLCQAPATSSPGQNAPAPEESVQLADETQFEEEPAVEAMNDQTPEIGRVVRLVREGRELIALGQGKEARELLAEADALDHGRLRTRLWLGRALIEMNYLNDALDLIDDLAAAGHEGAEIDYLYGMAFTYKARKYIVEGVGGGMIGMHFADSVQYLTAATEADPMLYADAFLPLAEAAWNSQQLDEARAAADAAVEISSSGADELFMRGEVAFSQFVVANADEARQEEAAEHWQVAFDSFQEVASSQDLERIEFRASAAKKAGDALVWKGRLPEASAQYAEAMGISPAAVDYGQVLGSLGQGPFLASLEAGAASFAQNHAPDDASDATLLWWLGWARYDAQDYAAAIDAFERSYAKWPDFTNCQWYIALCKYHTQDLDGAIETLFEHVQLDIAGLVNSVQSDLSTNLRLIDNLVGFCFSNGRVLDAARLSAIQANSAPDFAPYWNNVGLFYRDAGDGLRRAGGGDVERADLRKQYYEKSLEGYERALALEPENPALLNDTAVILHYCLRRDLERAKAMYQLSNERANIELARADLSEALRELYSVAKRDSANNLIRLEEMMRSRIETDDSEGQVVPGGH